MKLFISEHFFFLLLFSEEGNTEQHMSRYCITITSSISCCFSSGIVTKAAV